jgi:hypothetical protein
MGLVLCGSQSGAAFFRGVVPDTLLHDTYVPDALRRLQRHQRSERRSESRLGRPDGHDHRAFVVIEDCVSQRAWNDAAAPDLLVNNRYHRLAALPSENGLPHGLLRSQFEYVFVLGTPGVAESRWIYHAFARCIVPTFAAFCALLDAASRVDHQALVIQRGTMSTRVEDFFSVYRAQERPPFRACAPRLWELDEPSPAAGASPAVDAAPGTASARRA